MQQVWLNDAMVFIVIGIIVVLAVVVLRVFFDVRAVLRRRHLQQSTLLKTLPGLGQHPMRVRLKDGCSYEGLMLSGVVDAEAARDAGLPHPLAQLVCFARADGSQVWIDCSAIRVIETIRGEPVES